MKTKILLSLILCIAFAVLISACGKEDGEKKVKTPSDEPVVGTEETKADEPMVRTEETKADEPMVGTEETKVEEADKSNAGLAVLATGGALMAEENSAGAKENGDGVGHYKEGHWEESEKFFRKALEVNANLAEAHYNLALALDKLGNHGDATEHFKKALELAPENPKIKDSKILKDHVGA